MQKLHKLRDLQRRRDLSEKYYAQEMRRLIGDQAAEAKAAQARPAPDKAFAAATSGYPGDRAAPSALDVSVLLVVGTFISIWQQVFQMVSFWLD